MGKILKDTSGNILISGGKALEVTATVDSNIIASNIKKDVIILGVTGTYIGDTSNQVNIYNGSGLPDNAQGNNGDIYIQI